MRKTRILAIAPYEGLKEILQNESAAFADQIDVSVYVGDLQDGLAIARSLEKEGFDAIVSRGGTAELLERNLSLPVVDIAPTALDVLRYVRMARNTAVSRAIVAFPAITDIARKLFDIVEQSEAIYTIHNEDEARELIVRLREKGCSLVVGDAIAVSTAQKAGINAITIASGAESVQAAFCEAIRLCRLTQRYQERNLLFRSILDESALNVLVFDQDQRLLYTNLSADQMDYPRVFRSVSSCVAATLDQGQLRVRRKSKGFIWDVTGRRIRQPGGALAVFYIEKKLLPQEDSNVVEYYHMLDDNAQPPQAPVDRLGVMGGLHERIQKLGKTLLPVMVISQRGAPVDELLRSLCLAGPWGMHTIVTVDCSLLTEAAFQWLLESEDSVLFTNQLNVFMKRVDELPGAMVTRYADFAATTALHKRCHVLYSAWGEPQGELADFLNASGCAIFTLPPLRSRREDIPGLANLYLSALNTELGRQALGFAPAAMDRLQKYDWPGNQAQLRRVIHQALVVSQDELLSEEDVQAGLDRDDAPPPAGAAGSLSLEGTLEEITARAVRAVMEEEGMSRTRTVQRLGISRSTLWRMLK